MPEYIYRIANTVDKLIYIGRTDNLHKRWLKHTDNARHGNHRPLYQAMRTYGIEKFYLDIVEECLDYATAKSQETYWIRHLDTVYPRGYNARAPKLNDTEAAIIKYDSWDWRAEQYARYFNVSVGTVRQLQAGWSHFHVTREHLPEIITSFR